DWAAGALIAAEAGAVLRLPAADNSPGFIVASAPGIADEFDAVLASLRPDATQSADPALLTKIHSSTC
ncbi:hypothetical protein BST36_30830, partial [Mycolicibacterium moriokaense]